MVALGRSNRLVGMLSIELALPTPPKERVESGVGMSQPPFPPDFPLRLVFANLATTAITSAQSVAEMQPISLLSQLAPMRRRSDKIDFR